MGLTDPLHHTVGPGEGEVRVRQVAQSLHLLVGADAVLGTLPATGRGGLRGILAEGATVITAIVLVETTVERIPEVAQEIAEIKGISEVYSVTGDVDLVAIVRVHEHDQLADVIADHLSKVEGVKSTKTYLAFRTYSQHDLDAAFALGFNGE